MKTNKEIINEKHKGLVQNLGESAQLLSFNQVMELMELAKEEVTLKFLIKKWLKGKRKNIIIPNEIAFKCVIETPQFHGSMTEFSNFKQQGMFYKDTLKFHTDTWFGHDVQFHSMKDFEKSLVKIL